ncbi:hypothetical protein Ndes2437B_g05501 [Nannochloris sp. 'desiccata']
MSSQHPTQMSSIKIRQYSPSTDRSEVIEICKDVYGGFDALPKVIDTYHTQPDTYIYVCEAEGTLQSLICCQLRGQVFYIWGARTRDVYRGKGMAKLLLRHLEVQTACLYSLDSTSIAGFLSTTIQENAPMRRIFNLNGYVEHCLIDIVSLTSENIKNLKESDSSSLVNADSMTLQYCTCVIELQIALKSLRHHRQAANLDSTSSSHDSTDAIPLEPNWLPGEYVPWPVECDQVKSFIKEKKIFIVSFPNENASTPTTAQAVIFLGIGDHGSPFAGIVAASWPALLAAVEHALKLDSGCTRLYIDRCDAIDRELLHQKLDGGLRDYIVLYKPLLK